MCNDDAFYRVIVVLVQAPLVYLEAFFSYRKIDTASYEVQGKKISIFVRCHIGSLREMASKSPSSGTYMFLEAAVEKLRNS